MNIQNLDLSAKELNGQVVMEFPVYDTRLPMLRLPCSLLWGQSYQELVYNEETRILLLEIRTPRSSLA